MQSSANLSGGAEARCLVDVPPVLLDGADLVLDGGELPGIASTMLDLRGYEADGRWRIVREGPAGLASCGGRSCSGIDKRRRVVYGCHRQGHPTGVP
jgi:hypothetical protein